MQTGILKYLIVLVVSCCLTSSFVVSQEDETIDMESVTTKSQEEIDRELQQELDTMGITAHTGVKQAMAIVKQEEAIQSDMDEAMKKQKAAELLSDIGSGLMASTLVPLIPLAIGHAMNIGFSGGLAVHFATAGLLLSLAEVIRKKQSNTENRNS